MSDSASRDLTVNALYYDDQRKVVADPTGRGLADLRATPIAAVTLYRGDDPAEQARIILRCLKFKLRWPGLDLSEITRWVGTLPADLVARIPAHEWRSIDQARDRCVPEPSRKHAELSIAAELGGAAVQLIEHLRQKTTA